MPGLAGCYVRFCAAHLRQLEECISRHDVASVSRIAQTLTGNARRIGLSELSSLGRQLEEYCLGTDWNAIDSTYRAIADTVLKLCDSTPVRIKVKFVPNGHVKELCVKSIG